MALSAIEEAPANFPTVVSIQTMYRFTEALAPAGFNAKALVVGYGMAECSLAVSFSQPGQGLIVDHVDSGLILRIQRLIRRKLGIDCKIEPVPRHTLSRTTSGKLARAKARQEYINRMARTIKTVRYARV